MNSQRHYFEQLRSGYEKSLDQSLAKRQPRHSLLHQHSPERVQGESNNMYTLTSESSDPGCLLKPPKKKKSVRFQVYNANNLNSIKSMRDSKFQELERFSRERSHSRGSQERQPKGSREPIQVTQQNECNPFSGQSSINHREDFKENTFGAQPFRERLSQLSHLSNAGINTQQNPFQQSPKEMSPRGYILTHSVTLNDHNTQQENEGCPLDESDLSSALKRMEDQQEQEDTPQEQPKKITGLYFSALEQNERLPPGFQHRQSEQNFTGMQLEQVKSQSDDDKESYISKKRTSPQ